MARLYDFDERFSRDLEREPSYRSRQPIQRPTRWLNQEQKAAHIRLSAGIATYCRSCNEIECACKPGEP
jgi:hypothetical protein